MDKDNDASSFQDTDLSANMEDYIETIALLAKKNNVVRVKDIAKSLSIKMPSVTAALIKLKDKNLISYEKYGYIELTDSGKREAGKVYHKHECIAEFLSTFLGLDRIGSEDVACRLEHHMNADLCRRITRLLEFHDEEGKSGAEWPKKIHALFE
jgi:DtxR family transcriptional regulator, Mn-dependent transcriptional regulator